MKEAALKKNNKYFELLDETCTVAASEAFNLFARSVAAAPTATEVTRMGAAVSGKANCMQLFFLLMQHHFEVQWCKYEGLFRVRDLKLNTETTTRRRLIP
jgi:hypothetical protein